MLIYRVARPAPAAWNLFKTLVVTALFSAVFAWAIPTAIVAVQRDSGELDALFFPQQELPGKIVFALATLVVFWAAAMLAIKGAGTPLSFNSPRRLVIGGPYAWLRTPMVTGTILQGVGIGLIEGSVLVMIYGLILAVLWNSFVRPTEEDQMQSQFGRDFELYRRSVRCWLPMRMPWRPPAGDPAPISLDETPDPTRRRRRKGIW